MMGGLVEIVFTNQVRVVWEKRSGEVSYCDYEYFFKISTPYVDPKPPLKVEAWVGADGHVAYYVAGTRLDDLVVWIREPRLDYEV